MNTCSRVLNFAQQTFNAATIAALCAVMVTPPAFAAEGISPESHPITALPSEKPVGPLTQQQKVLHALNRFTFGPRPGDEAAVTRMGLNTWFERQLHPETIDDSAFDERMLQFPAMQLSQVELMRRFPSPQMIRQIENRGGSVPHDAVEKAIYADAAFTYEAQRRKQEKSADAATAPQAPAAGDQADESMTQQPAMDAAAANTTTPAPGFAGKGKKSKLEKHTVPVAGMSAEDVQAVLSLPPDERFNKIVAMTPQEAVSFRDSLRGFERVTLMRGMTPQQVEAVTAMQAPVRVVGAEAMETRLLRDVYSDRQLQAVMTDFWLNHFNVYAKKNQNEPYMLPDYERKVILPNALGKFENLLIATASSPAMLMYLDNWESVGPDSPAAQRIGQFQKYNPNGQIAQKLPKGINENYGRELMELHTLGVNGGYTQKDVIEVARCFTGWTINRPYGGGGGFRRAAELTPADTIPQGAFVFDMSRHEPGDKLVLGHVIKDGGAKEGLEVLHILATDPHTAHFISKELAQRFVADNPPPALVDRMAATFLKTDGDIKSVLRTMFHSPEFWSPAVYRAKVKTPIEFMASALRASNATVNNAIPLVQAMERLGMPIYGMQTPNGYSWQAEDWVSSNALISRMNFALVLSGGRMPGTRTNWPTLLGDANPGLASSPTPATEKDLEALLLGQTANPRTRATVLDQFNNPTAQHMAETNFNARPVDDQEMDQNGAGMQQARLLRAKAGRYNNNGNFDQLANQPETPLDTMAGLLLGSPDFQRR